MKQVVLMLAARKALTRMPRPVAERILDKIELYGRAPEALANIVKQLKAGEVFRLRVGDWRVLFDEDEATIVVRAVRPRGSAYG